MRSTLGHGCEDPANDASFLYSGRSGDSNKEQDSSPREGQRGGEWTTIVAPEYIMHSCISFYSTQRRQTDSALTGLFRKFIVAYLSGIT